MPTTMEKAKKLELERHQYTVKQEKERAEKENKIKEDKEKEGKKKPWTK